MTARYVAKIAKEEVLAPRFLQFEVGKTYLHYCPWTDRDVLVLCKDRDGQNVTMVRVRKDKDGRLVETGKEVTGKVKTYKAGFEQDIVEAIVEGIYHDRKDNFDLVVNIVARTPAEEVEA